MVEYLYRPKSLKTRACKKCGQGFNGSNFYKIPSTGQVMSYCKTCHNKIAIARRAINPNKFRELLKQWKQENLGKVKAWRKRDVKTWQAKNRAWLWEYKSTLDCSRCGYNSHPAAIQFHHVNGKTMNISEMVRKYSIEKIKGEIAKCIPLCANCHTIEHCDGNNEPKFNSIDSLQLQLELPCPRKGWTKESI